MFVRSSRALVLNALLVFSCLFTFGALPAHAVLRTANDLASGAWQTNSNWTLSAAPAAGPQNGDPVGDTWAVTIDSHNINLTNASRTVDSLTLSSPGFFTFDEGASGNPEPTLTVTNALTINSGTFFARGSTNTAINAGSFTNSGTFRVGGTSNIHNDVTVNVPTALVNNGQLELQRNNGWQGRLNVIGSAMINNGSTGTIAISSVVPHSGLLQLNSSISNSGAVTIGANAPTTFGLASATYTNNTAGSSFTVDSALTISGASSTFTQTLGTTTINATGSIGGSGLSSFQLNGGNLIANGTLTSTNFTQGGGAISGSGSIVASGGNLNLNSGSASGALTMKAASIVAATPAQLNINPAYTYDVSTELTGYVNVTGPFTVNAGRTFSALATTGATNGQTVTAPAFTNLGTTNVSGSGAGWHIALNIPTGTLINGSTGIINLLDGTGSGSNRTLSAELQNQGTVNVHTNSTTPTIGRAGAVHTNTGLIDIKDTVSFTGTSFTQTAGTFQLTSGTASFSTPTVSFIGGTIQGGAGALATNVNATTGGTGLTLSPGQSTGLLDINGNVLLNANDSVAIEIGGTTQAALVNGYDWADILGTTGLGNSSLVVTLVNGFTPTPANTFTILTATGGLSGTFGNTVLGTITGSGYTFNVTYTGNSVVLSNAQEILPAPEPSSLYLLGMGVLILVGRRRKQIEA
jgi:fibronectin-binding autotransporter adhesin